MHAARTLIKPPIGGFIVSYPLIPVVAIPSTKYFWARKNINTQGSIARIDIAIILLQSVEATSIDILKPREIVYLLALLM